MTREEIIIGFKSIQENICRELSKLDGLSQFSIEPWEHHSGGGGITRVIQNGKIFEKGGVNFSSVEGVLPENIQNALKISDNRFFATGVSIVIHPSNPFHPIIHMNIRYFELEDGTYWFGGGIDLTPIYVNSDESKFFHQSLKNTCDKFDSMFYPKFKSWADDYFFIPHRKETRGIGGIFFDRLHHRDCLGSKQKLAEFVMAVGNTFAPTYCQIILNKSSLVPFNEENKLWQKVRRGRYVEFNLVYDKGTKFGLDTEGRIESILMSLPPQVEWHYNFQTKANSDEENTTLLLKKGIQWI